MRLQARWSALTSSLILGVLWALYHLPLFFMPGSFHQSQGAGSAWFWLFMVQVVGMAVVMSWIFNNTRGSTLGAILFHFTVNFAFTIGNVTAGTNLHATLLWVMSAGAVVTLRKDWGTPRFDGATAQ